jgi:hypothetical protein
VELARCPQMVAFVPARTATGEALVAQTTVAGPGDGDRVVDVRAAVARGDYGLHAVETKGILPAGRGDAPLDRASSRRAVAQSAEPAGEAAPREVLLRAETSDADAGPAKQKASSGFAGQPEYVVFTAWEEVRTSPRNAGMVSDYDASANAQPQSGDSENQAAKQTEARPATQIIVTRMIFAVYRVDAGTSDPASGTKPADAGDSGQTSAPQQPQSGWLVLQL